MAHIHSAWTRGSHDGRPQRRAAWGLRRETSSERPGPWLAQLERAGILRSLRYPSTSLGELLDQTAGRFGPLCALIYGEDTWTYRALAEQVNRAAGGLAGLGVRRGDCVLLALPNCPAFVISFFAIQKLGAVVVNAGPLIGADHLEELVALTRPRVVIGLDLQTFALSRACRDSCVTHRVSVSLAAYQPLLVRLGYRYKLWHEHRDAGDHAGEVPFERLLSIGAALPAGSPPDPREVAVLQPTGGTTGSPKLAQLSHYNLIANSTQLAAWVPIPLGQGSILAVLPMFHVFGLTCCLVTSVLCGVTMIALTRFRVQEVLDTLRRHRPSIFPLVPAICDAISDALEIEQSRRNGRQQAGADWPGLEGVRVCISGAAPLPPASGARFERLTGVPILEGYGLTEAGPVTHANPLRAIRPGRIGLPMPDTRVRVVDPADPQRDLPPHERGELWVSGPQIMSGYYRNSEETARVLVRDAQGAVWLRTGDIVTYDEDGYFQVIDRAKDMINRSGLKVYPARVEAVLRMHPEVADVAVVGRPDPVHTEQVVAVVAARNAEQVAGGREQESLAAALGSLCREHLSAYEVPAVFEFVEALPRSPLGKLLRRELRDGASRSRQPVHAGEGDGRDNGAGAAGAAVAAQDSASNASPSGEEAA